MAFNWMNPFQTTTIMSIRPGDRMFRINNGFMASDRASIEISPKCPSHIANMIAQAYEAGYIKPVAHVTEKEYVLMGLGNG